MDKSTPIGVGVGLVLIYGAIFMGEGWQMFFDPASLLLVVGGTTAALFVTFSLSELKQIPEGVRDFITFEPPELDEYVDQFSELSRVARREGLLALDRRLSEVKDLFMRFGLEMAVDGIEEVEIDELLRTRIREETKQRKLISKFFTNAGTYSPAFGMIGTLIGLIQMMQNLEDPSQIGSGMAVALITTFYGAVLANLIFLPIATKVKTQTEHELKARGMIRTGILAIVRGESPSMIEKRLQPYLNVDASSDEEVKGPTPLSKAA